MAKFSMNINGVDQGAAEERKPWAGELPTNGAYSGVLKSLSTAKITGEDSEYKGQDKLIAVVELRDTPEGKYDGFPAITNLSLIEVSIPFINQFLLALTDGSDSQFLKIKEAFYNEAHGGIVTDERKKHVEAIGPWKIGSPNGELPIKVALKQEPFYDTKTKVSTTQIRIVSFLLDEGTVRPAGQASNGPAAAIEEEEAIVVAEDESEEDAVSVGNGNLLDD